MDMPRVGQAGEDFRGPFDGDVHRGGHIGGRGDQPVVAALVYHRQYVEGALAETLGVAPFLSGLGCAGQVRGGQSPQHAMVGL
jgi:hypothetical protein